MDKNGDEIRCYLRGKILNEYKLKKDKLITLDIAAVGDIVEFNLNEDGTGVIEEILERKNHISRKAPRMKGASYRGERLEQIIAANVDKMIIVNSWELPKFNNRLVDRMLVVAESSGVAPSIVINKIDLDESNVRNKFVNLYRSIGYKVFETSTINNSGIMELKEFIRNSVALFWGHSGVGKSSLLNKLYPDLNFKVGEVSDYNKRGRHTTVTAVMKKVEENTFVIDTPGIREIDPYGIKKEDLGHFFIEFGEFIQNCRFNTCTHYHEPGCGVIEAYRDGKISRERYESYLALLETIEEDLFF
ncbi:ribosome small subunit-dependent GTPase A [Melioribacter roseus P3M-2]|uniref:Small ribosomal subunit biogenesis GTPase RsgA n=1 Tax=Melioribacter roseus (strain DSM 23840 / JCM 17771 / VKM B-2668 / P3M-2) TaxID=1191523 RepID=I6ZTB4_MELRP|nr:ribosome small subunit-dependent GTPase A [Melioribacter roseus]AFN75284.1 ribosome small subunit-dependent GTPase A [Melioribacter roseus P3M-2]